MSVPVTPRPRRTSAKQRMSPAVPLLLLVVAAVAGGRVTPAAPAAATGWVLAVVVCAWSCLGAGAVIAVPYVRQTRGAAETARRELRAAQCQATLHEAEADQMRAAVPALLERLPDGARADEALATTPQPSDPRLRRLLQTFASRLAAPLRLSAS